MGRTRKTYSAAFKAKVALEAIKEEKTIEELSSVYKVASTQVKAWRKQIKENAEEVFASGKSNSEKEKEELIEKLYRELGKLQVEHEWLKKKIGAV